MPRSSPRPTKSFGLVRLVMGLSMFTSGCAHAQAKSELSDAIEARSGAAIDLERKPDDPPSLPPGVVLGDGLSRDEAVAIALWNNPTLRVELTRIDAAQANLSGAKRPTNPSLRLLFPISAASFAGLLTWPIETLATMPGRLALARNDLDATRDQIVQTSLDLTRDVRLAHADWSLAHERLSVLQELLAGRAEVLTIVEAQAALGDLSQAEIETARAEAAIANDERERAEGAVEIAEARLRTAIGFGLDEIDLTFAPEPLAALPAAPLAALELDASEQRPDLHAAELSIARAKTGLRLERAAMFNLAGVAQLSGRALQAGVQFGLPIFDQNQAGRGRAKAEAEAAAWRQRALRERIVGEVREAHARFEQALDSHQRYADEIVGSRERALAASREAFELGERDFTSVLLAQQSLDLARLRLVELCADARRAHAELERALGGRLVGGKEPEQP